jgi:hypothetical protein
MNSGDLSKLLEICIRSGFPLIIEDMDEIYDTILEPLLQKDF